MCGLPVGFSAPPGDWSPCITPPGSPCTIFSLCASSGRTPSSQPQGGFTGRELMLWIHRAIGGPAHVPSNQFWDGSKETNFGRDRRNGDGSKLHDLWLSPQKLNYQQQKFQTMSVHRQSAREGRRLCTLNLGSGKTRIPTSKLSFI